MWGVLVVLVDIQQLKQTEAALGERERQLSLITDSVGFPITYLDRQRVVRFVNRPSAEWAGFAPESMIGARAEELMPREVARGAMPLHGPRARRRTPSPTSARRSGRAATAATSAAT